MPSARCTRCSAQLSSGDAFCPECGLAVAVPAAVSGRRRGWRRPADAAPTVPAGALLATEHGALAIPVAESADPASRRRIAFWVFFSFVALLAMIAGVLTWQIIDTVGTVNSASTPPPSISAGMLGGSPDVAIDTGPAKTAVAVRDLGLTSTPTSTPAPTSTATAEPTATASSTPQPTATATTAPTKTVPAVVSSPGVAPSATPKATQATSPSPTATIDENDLPYAIDVPIDNLTATPVPGATQPAVSTANQAAITPTQPNVRAETATPQPTATATATLEPTAVPTVLSEIERVENGSFEQGATSWYLESGAGPVTVPDAAPDGTAMLQVPATGAYADQSIFFIPETAYYLSVAGRMTADGDSGVVGIVYRDAAGTRLTDLEPTPITFTSTRMSRKGLEFTPPAEVAMVSVYAYKDDGPAALQVDEVSVRSIVPPYSEGASVSAGPNLAKGAQTILIMGVDAREGEAIDGQVRPDSLMVVHLNPQSSACRILSIPRDTRTELPGYGLTKINHALAVGGIGYEVQVVSDLIDLPIDHYVLIDFTGFEDVVDALGGVTIDVPEPFTAIDGTVFQAGPQKMDGTRALSYARHRSDAEGDFGRIKRQQQVIRAVIKQSSGLEVLASIREFLPAIQENLRTDLSVPQMIDLATTYRSICTEDAVTMLRLEGEIATFNDPLLKMPLSYVVVDEAEIRRKVAALLEP
jgi:LCP family protein required for cell wall assembly